MLPLVFETDEHDNSSLRQRSSLDHGFIGSANVSLMEFLLQNRVSRTVVALIEVPIYNHAEACDKNICGSIGEAEKNNLVLPRMNTRDTLSVLSSSV